MTTDSRGPLKSCVAERGCLAQKDVVGLVRRGSGMSFSGKVSELVCCVEADVPEYARSSVLSMKDCRDDRSRSSAAMTMPKTIDDESY